MVEIYSKSLDRGICNVLLMKFPFNLSLRRKVDI